MRLYNLVILACTYCLMLHLKHRSCLMAKRRCKRPFPRRQSFPLSLWEESGQSLCNLEAFSLTSISTRNNGWFTIVFLRFKLNLPVCFTSGWTVLSYRAAAPSRSSSALCRPGRTPLVGEREIAGPGLLPGLQIPVDKQSRQREGETGLL